MTICYFGDFDPTYARNKVIIEGLKENGVTVLLCRTEQYNFWSKIKDLRHQLKKISKFDFFIVGYSDSRWVVPLLKVTSNKKIIWDAFYSRYDSWVADRQLMSPYSPKAWYHWFSDFLSIRLADKILLDTYTHIEYFRRTFIVGEHKFIRVLIGADNTIFYP